MFPFGDLPSNLAAFCAVLRDEWGFRLGAGELGDAARALEIVGIDDEGRVRDALRPVLASSREHAVVFDEAFTRFFYPGPAGIAQAGLPPPEVRTPSRQPVPEAASATAHDVSEPDDDENLDWRGAPDEAGPSGDHGEADDEPRILARTRYSPIEAGGRTTIALAPPDADWRAAARVLVRQVRLGLSRRWRPGRRGPRFDLRRTWRASLQTGGEALSPRWLHRPPRAPRFVVLVDGSRSMQDAQESGLALAVSIASVTPRIDVATFSTGLRSLTDAVRTAGRGQATVVSRPRETWGGGTDIGGSFRSYLQRSGERQLGPDTVVIIVSDGLDVGEPAVLGGAMRELHRRSSGVVWLNPLVQTPGYRPTSRGMAAARPFVSTFASAPDAAAVRRLAGRLRLRA